MNVLRALWRQQPDYRNTRPFASAAAPLVTLGQRQVATLTGTYLAYEKSVQLNRKMTLVVPPFADVTGAAVRGGVSPEEVYSRPVRQVWSELANGKDFDDAVRIGEQRLVKTVETDMELAATNTSKLIIEADTDVAYYRRVLTGSHSCALCVIASTNKYRRGDLLPIHPGCGCSVKPIYDELDDDTDEQEVLAGAHDAVRERMGKADAGGRSVDYRKLILTRVDGEYGPVLTVASHKFRDEKDLARKK